MKKIVILLVLMCFAPMAQAANSVTVPGDYTTIQTAVNAVDEGGTVTITDSATYTCATNLVIRKGVKIFASVGQTPTIRNSNTTSAAVAIDFTPTNTADSQIGSLDGGHIKLELVKATPVTGSVYNPTTAFIRMNHTTGTTVKLENVDMLETGVTTVAAITGILHNINNKSIVTLNYVDININRPTLTGGAYGIVVGATSGNFVNRLGGPTYNLNHVRLKGYSRAGVWNQFVDPTINLNYYESGTLGEQHAALSYPWAGFMHNQGATRMVGRFTNSIMRGPKTYDACLLQANGSSFTLSRCVFMNGFSLNATGMAGALRLAGTTAGTANAEKLKITADHCDIVDLSAYGSSVGALVRGSLTANEARTTVSLTLTNSNVFSLNNRAVNIPATNGGVTEFTSSHNNVFGAQTNQGYTAGTGDISFDPLYFDAANGDMRYYNNTLKTADTAGKPVGTNGDYSDVFNNGIIAGTEGEINSAKNWVIMN